MVRLIKTIEDVAYMDYRDNEIYFRKDNENLYILKGKDMEEVIPEAYEGFAIFNKNIIYKIEASNKIYLLNKNGSKEVLFDKDIEKEYLSIGGKRKMHNKIPIYTCKPDDYIPDGMYILDEEMKFDFHPPFSYVKTYKNYFFPINREKICAFHLFPKQKVWETEITNFGSKKEFNAAINALEKLPNELKTISSLLFEDDLIIALLQGNQLLALDLHTGKKNWFIEQERSGAYQLIDGILYKNDGLSLSAFDVKTGDFLRKIFFKGIRGLEDFHASGPIWAYEKILIVVDVLYGRIVIFNRITFEHIGYYKIGRLGIKNGQDGIVWQDNKLYVDGIDSYLRIFELE